MSGRWACLVFLAGVGCHGISTRTMIIEGPAPGLPAHPEVCDDECPDVIPECPPKTVRKPCLKPRATVVCAPKPKVEVRPGKDVEINVPRQKVVVCGPGGAAQAAAQGQSVEQQQIVQNRQVLLVPQQVLVPFVQTTATGPIRVNGLQETQVTNFATVTGVATQSAALTAGVAGAQVNVSQPAAAAAAGGTDPQSLAECLARLREYEARIRQLTTAAEKLDSELKRMKSAGPEPIAAPKSEPANWQPSGG